MTSQGRRIVIIPARYASTRFPGKPLAMLGGREVICRVAERAAESGVDIVLVATDDERIASVVERAGHKAVMTRADHTSGTDRVAEAYLSLCPDAAQLASDVVINIQGDEPFIRVGQIRMLSDMFDRFPATQIATLARRFDKTAGFEALFDSNLVKVVFGAEGRALYFSRSIIPYVRGAEWTEWLDRAEFHTHIGIYAYRAETLLRVTAMPRSALEKAESLEQLRWLEAGLDIRVGVTGAPTIGIDTPDDLAAAERYLAEHSEA